MIYCSFFFFFKQKTAYEMRISDWSSDVCSSDLFDPGSKHYRLGTAPSRLFHVDTRLSDWSRWLEDQMLALANEFETCQGRSEEHTSELQSLMRISYAVFCLKKKKNRNQRTHNDKINRQAKVYTKKTHDNIQSYIMHKTKTHKYIIQ